MSATVIDVLGGSKVLGKRADSGFNMVERIREGLPYSSLEALMRRLKLTREEASASLAVPLRTLARRKRERKLSATESDRLYRLARVGSQALAIFGTEEAAAHWLRSRIPALGMAVPLDLLDTDAGALEVQNVLFRVQHGVYS